MNDLAVIGDAALPELAGKINATVKAADESAVSAMQHAMKAGDLLRQAKAIVGHGDWLHWLDKNCDFSRRKAQAYMRLSSDVPALPDAEAQRVAHLPIRRAIQAMRAITTAPETPARYSTSRQLRGSSRDESIRASAVLKDGATATRKLASWLVDHMEVSPAQVEAIRKKLTAAIEALDSLVMRGAT